MSAILIASLLSAAQIVTTRLAVPRAPMQRIALHCMAPAQPTGRSVLFVHGASFPTMLAAGFEFAQNDSWMAFMASRGYLACGLDFLGFGASSRPPAMVGAETGVPVTRAPEAAAQLALAVAHLRSVHGIEQVHLVAHSWGTISAAAYASTQPPELASLTLFGPVVPVGRRQMEQVGTAWWGITAQARYRQLRYVDVLPHGMVLLEPAVDAGWSERFEASAPRVAGDPPGQLRIPSGPVADIADARAGRYPYLASRVGVPVFLVYGDHDTVVDDASAAPFLAGFTGSPLRWRLRIDHGTHVMHLESARRSLYQSVDAFISAAEALR
ncbi:alpha/beta fold hydrolase [Frateuria hangzhouensis]|uniref:alpha/beta fold hydrolase n=1 Tax=Frateuria hangzhouensis TaxID=2995589 RepID=UPI002260D0AA|nr:alpha/beta fold hydrolase [Frateuria sp. STR12]MCX7513870.1 alpha/beta fold hydrolase [Frateuria sp. STR12]